jgi:M3 family oligoendopeptidase
MTSDFAAITAPRPTRESLAAERAAIEGAIDAGRVAEALAAWEPARRRYQTWRALVGLRFAQDTRDVGAKADREYADELGPEAAEHTIALKRRFLEAGDGLIDAHASALWRCDLATFDPAIKPDLREEAGLSRRYTALLASARIEFRGRTLNLAGLDAFAEDADRATRHDAERARWGFFAANGAELDAIYADLTAVRTRMARKLGYDQYTPLGYRRMRRTDYGPADVARYRDQVARHVTPLVGRILEQRRGVFGWDRVRFWDEALIDPAGNPKPAGDHDALVTRARTMFDRLHPDMGAFYRRMEGGGFLDLRNRDGKAGGGFCTSFPTIGMPFIFANFNDTHHDIGVFTHEMGHAFQNWSSRDKALSDHMWPTMEAAEIHSMSLEFLVWPQIGLLVGDAAADRFRRMHLIGALAFLPYGVCVDHFQHEVYANPDASPEDRHAIWQRLERLYMPWVDYGDLAYPAKGGRWQAKHHIYSSPFYHIDYTLAQCCALQFWSWSRRDPAGAMAAYVALCARGGEAPFQALVRSAGLVSPFTEGALATAVDEAAAFLAI